MAEAQARRLTTRSDLAALLALGPRAGVAALRPLLDADAPPSLTRSQAEERLLALIRAADLPPPETNVRIDGLEVDFLWRDARLIVEVDGFAFHSSRTAFERDRARDAVLAAAGYRVIRVTWRQIVNRPEALIARIATAVRA
jgi:very-short-patch-repair endonuclease